MKLATTISGGPVALNAGIESGKTTTTEAEVGGAEKLRHTAYVSRTISSAVGNVAMWELLRTPTQSLRGSYGFSATLLIPIKSEDIELTVHHSANIDKWGDADRAKEYKLKIPSSNK